MVELFGVKDSNRPRTEAPTNQQERQTAQQKHRPGTQRQLTGGEVQRTSQPRTHDPVPSSPPSPSLLRVHFQVPAHGACPACFDPSLPQETHYNHPSTCQYLLTGIGGSSASLPALSRRPCLPLGRKNRSSR
ncbi:IgGFc-binding protein [Manis javanica]|nr:IgGFc-binding protein [Manis javanica]